MSVDGKTARFGAGLVVFVCFLVAAIEGYDIQAFGVASPKLVRELGLGPAQQGWGAAAAMIGLMIGAIVGGRLADRIGRKPVLLVSVAAFGLFSLATAVSPSYEILLWARLATGLGFGGALPNLLAIATEVTPVHRQTAVTTAMCCGMPVGGTIAALAAQLGGAALDWRTIFVAGGIVPLLLLPVIFLLIPETRPAARPEADRRVLQALFGEGRGPRTVLISLALLPTTGILNLALNWLPTLVTDRGHPASLGASAALAFNLSAIVGSVFLGVFSNGGGWRRLLPLALLTLAATLGGLAFTDAPSAIMVLSGAAGFLVVGSQFVMYALSPQLYPEHVRATGAGGVVSVGRIGSIIGPVLAGQLRAAGATPGAVFLALIPAAVMAAIALIGLGRAARDA